MKRRSWIIVAAALVGGALTTLGVAGALASGSSAGGFAPGSSAGDNLTGMDYIQAQKLPSIDPQDSSCRFGMDFNEVVYCLDSVAPNAVEARMVAGQIRGAIPTDERRALVEAQEAVAVVHEELSTAEASGDDAAMSDARARLDAAVEQLKAADAAFAQSER